MTPHLNCAHSMADHDEALKEHLAKLARHREVSAELKDLRLQAKVANAVYQKTEDDLTALQVRRRRASARTLLRPSISPPRAHALYACVLTRPQTCGETVAEVLRQLDTDGTDERGVRDARFIVKVGWFTAIMRPRCNPSRRSPPYRSRRRRSAAVRAATSYDALSPSPLPLLPPPLPPPNPSPPPPPVSAPEH